MLTVRELLRELDVRLSCGEAGLDAPVRWVHISELRDPTPWLSGGELLLTTGMQLDTAKRQREFVARLADHQLAGLGLGTGFAHDAVPKAMIEAAEDRDFPVFEVPYEVPFIAITEKAFTRLVNEQYAVLQRSIAAHERLERIVLSERGLEAVVTALATLVGGAALVFDARGHLLAQRRFQRPLARRGRRVARPRAAVANAHRPPSRLRARRSRPGRARARAAGGGHGRADPRRRPAPGVARGGQGQRRTVGVRPPHPAPGGHDHRARAPAPPGGRGHRAPARRRRAVRPRERRAVRRRARAPPGAVRDPRPGRRSRARSGGAQRRAGCLRGGLRGRPGRSAARRGGGRARGLGGRLRLRAAPRRRRGRPLRPGRARGRADADRARRRRLDRRRPRRAGGRRPTLLPRGALRARGAGPGRQRQRSRRGDAGSRPTATWAPSSCCCRSRTSRPCGCSATRSSGRSRTARATTAAS